MDDLLNEEYGNTETSIGNNETYYYYYYMDYGADNENGTMNNFYYKNGTKIFYGEIDGEIVGEMDHSYLFYIDGIALTCVAIFGVIGTILAMIVLLKSGIHDLFSSFLTALSICDTIFLLLAVFYLALPELSDW